MIIQSLQRTNQILSLFSIQKPRWGITEIANRLDMPKTTVSGLIRTLAEIGFLEQEPATRRYGLGPKLFTLGIIMGETLEINKRAQGLARQLAERKGLICRIAIWDRDAALITLDITPREAEVLARRIGPRVVAYCSSLGRALLAYSDPQEIENYLKNMKLVPFTPQTITRKDLIRKELKQIKVRGYAINNQELTPRRASIAAPIFKSDGSVAASISLVGTPESILGDDFENLVDSLQDTAAGISREMGYSRESPEVTESMRVSI